MSIQTEINRINNNISNSYEACENKGATMPSDLNTDNLAETINSIPSGSSSGDYAWAKFQDAYYDDYDSLQAVSSDIIYLDESVSVTLYVAYDYTFDESSGEYTLVDATTLGTIEDGSTETYDVDFSYVMTSLDKKYMEEVLVGATAMRVQNMISTNGYVRIQVGG